VQFCQEQGLRRFAELVDQLVMLGPGFVSEAVCELEGLSVAEFAAFEYHAYGLAANKWNNSAVTPILWRIQGTPSLHRPAILPE